MIYELTDVLRRLKAGPAAAIAEWEADYRRQIRDVADFIAENRAKSPVVLLAGPSASSKTSSATRIVRRLIDLGVNAHLLSMDNYFIDRDAPDFPALPNGSPDLESPECLDMALLNEHFSMLERGQDVYMPEYDFLTQRRAEGKGIFLDAEPGDVFLFEGIHALNQRFTARHPDAARIYVSPEADYTRNGLVFCTPVQLRLMRRLVRDNLFRGASAEYSLSLWKNVVDSEARHILPYQSTANRVVTTALPYELGVLKLFVAPLLEELPQGVPCGDQAAALGALLRDVPGLDAALVPEDSILREFIGPAF